jgi:FkbH-like protein
MFDFDKYERRLHGEGPAAPSSQYRPVSNSSVSAMSQLFWGEHCVECAAPSCYESCDLYQPRPDKRCRRFTYGSFKNRNFPSLRGYGVEISFKKWAKIEAAGRLTLAPVAAVLLREKLIEWAAPVADLIGKVLGRITKNNNWDSITYLLLQRLARRASSRDQAAQVPDALLFEVYNPSPETVRMQLNILPKIEGENGAKTLLRLQPSFVTTLSFPTGYSRHEIAASRFQSVAAPGGLFTISMIPEADNNARLVFLTADFVKFAAQPAAEKGANKIKCVVWDLDNTLWKGILIEGDDIAVRPEVEQLLKHLDERGILLSIASKNDHASAWQKLEQLGLAKYFLYPQISWGPKSLAIKTVAERLNIGLDTFAFIDDNPFELDQVGKTLPGVLCIDAKEIATLFTDPRFRGSSSAESRQRRQMYQETITREEAQKEFGTNYLQFLASCGIKLEIAAYSPEHQERVAELVQRTNQLNFSGHKYTRDQLNEILADEHLEKYVLRSSDDYGSYGTVGFCIANHRNDIMQIRDFMLSCRVQGKFIEQAFFYHLLQHHNPHNAKALWVNYHETARNKPALQVLNSLGFQKHTASSDSLFEGMIHSSPEALRCDFISVQCTAGSREEPLGISDILKLET